jgi:uncharacterized protein YidB (DUF937 family)
MGLMDILNGMQNGPRGQRQPGGSSGGGGMSPLTMALIGLLAYKAMKHLGGSASAPTPGGAGRTASLPPGGTIPGGNVPAGTSAGGGLADVLGGLFGGKPGGAVAGGKPGGSLADMIPGGLGGVLGGAAAGTVLSGGLDSLIKGFQQSGHGKEMQSWIGTGQNEDIAPGDLASALGNDTIDALTKQTGMSRDDLLHGLSQQLPDFIDQLTPHGRPLSAEEASRMV